MNAHNMTVQDLIDSLSDYPPDAIVRFASQPSWPFEYEIADLYMPDADPSTDEDGEPDAGPDDPEPAPPVVYLVEGRQLAYLPGRVARGLGWK